MCIFNVVVLGSKEARELSPSTDWWTECDQPDIDKNDQYDHLYKEQAQRGN